MGLQESEGIGRIIDGPCGKLPCQENSMLKAESCCIDGRKHRVATAGMKQCALFDMEGSL